MKITMSQGEDRQSFDARLFATQRGWSGFLAFPVAPLPALEEGATPERIEDMVGPRADALGPDGDFAEDRDDFEMDDVIFQGRSAELLLDYPLERPALLRIEDFPGRALTPRLVLKVIQEAYQEIYRIEEGGEEVPASQSLAGGEIVLNRPATNGMFGISMHGIHDLFVEGIEVGEAEGDHAILRISMGS